MAKKAAVIQTVRCMINIGGDLRHSIYRDSRFDPVETTYPETVLLKALHTDQGVTDVVVVGHVERSAAEEKDRLSAIYGANFVNNVYPGVDGGRMPTHSPEQTPLTDEELMIIERAKRNNTRAATQGVAVEE